MPSYSRYSFTLILKQSKTILNWAFFWQWLLVFLKTFRVILLKASSVVQKPFKATNYQRILTDSLRLIQWIPITITPLTTSLPGRKFGRSFRKFRFLRELSCSHPPPPPPPHTHTHTQDNTEHKSQKVVKQFGKYLFLELLHFWNSWTIATFSSWNNFNRNPCNTQGSTVLRNSVIIRRPLISRAWAVEEVIYQL